MMDGPSSVLVHPYTPRPYFNAFHEREQRWAVLVAHRRAGKSVGLINDCVARALYTRKTHAKYAYIAPYYTQAKEVMWDYLKRYTEGFTDKVMESELAVTLVNGNRIRLYGADNPDSLRGIYLDGAMFDEYADIAEYVWTSIVRPMLADRKGWAVFSGTPKGPDNHLKKMWDLAQENPDSWFSLMLKASETGILSKEELADALALMGEDEYLVEFECDFYAAQKGAIYGKEMRDLETSHRLTPHDLYDPSFLVIPVLDIGSRDATAITFVQPLAGEFRVIDYWEANRASVEEVDTVLRDKPYKYEKLWLPHDAWAKSFQTGKSTVEQFLERGWQVARVASLSRQDGIQAARRTFPSMVMQADKCKRLAECLRNYKRKYNRETKSYSREPEHDQYSHGADSFRYACLAVQEANGGFVAAKPVEGPKRKGFMEICLNDLWPSSDNNESRRI